MQQPALPNAPTLSEVALSGNAYDLLGLAAAVAAILAQNGAAVSNLSVNGGGRSLSLQGDSNGFSQITLYDNNGKQAGLYRLGNNGGTSLFDDVGPFNVRAVGINFLYGGYPGAPAFSVDPGTGLFTINVGVKVPYILMPDTSNNHTYKLQMTGGVLTSTQVS